MDMDDALPEHLSRSVETLLDDDVTPPPDVPSGGAAAPPSLTSVGDAASPNPMLALASAMLDAQGPRPTFSDFASAAPPNNPFGEAHVYVTRHGARIDNGPDADPQWLFKAGHGRRDDPHLSPAGRVAASELAERLATSCVPRVAHIVSSPHVRCLETATAVAERFGV